MMKKAEGETLNSRLAAITLPDADRQAYRAAGHRQRLTSKNPFQLGGSFVFAPGDVDLFVHLSGTFGDNARPEDLLAALP